LFAEELAIAEKNITIITNSIFLKNYTSGLTGINLIFLAGSFQPESQVMVGPLTVKSAENIYTDKFFLGTNGFIPGQAFTCRDHLRAETAVGLSKRTNKVFILTESDKFIRRGAYSLFRLENITGVFTDDKIPKEAEAALIKNNVQLYKIPVVEEKIRWRQFSGLPPILYTEKAE
jgi:DeoR/GlpR family transcriptional regulator of sugar metabolism